MPAVEPKTESLTQEELDHIAYIQRLAEESSFGLSAPEIPPPVPAIDSTVKEMPAVGPKTDSLTQEELDHIAYIQRLAEESSLGLSAPEIPPPARAIDSTVEEIPAVGPKTEALTQEELDHIAYIQRLAEESSFGLSAPEIPPPVPAIDSTVKEMPAVRPKTDLLTQEELDHIAYIQRLTEQSSFEVAAPDMPSVPAVEMQSAVVADFEPFAKERGRRSVLDDSDVASKYPEKHFSTREESEPSVQEESDATSGADQLSASDLDSPEGTSPSHDVLYLKARGSIADELAFANNFVNEAFGDPRKPSEVIPSNDESSTVYFENAHVEGPNYSAFCKNGVDQVDDRRIFSDGNPFNRASSTENIVAGNTKTGAGSDTAPQSENKLPCMNTSSSLEASQEDSRRFFNGNEKESGTGYESTVFHGHSTDPPSVSVELGSESVPEENHHYGTSQKVKAGNTDEIKKKDPDALMRSSSLTTSTADTAERHKVEPFIRSTSVNYTASMGHLFSRQSSLMSTEQDNSKTGEEERGSKTEQDYQTRGSTNVHIIYTDHSLRASQSSHPGNNSEPEDERIMSDPFEGSVNPNFAEVWPKMGVVIADDDFGSAEGKTIRRSLSEVVQDEEETSAREPLRSSLSSSCVTNFCSQRHAHLNAYELCEQHSFTDSRDLLCNVDFLCRLNFAAHRLTEDIADEAGRELRIHFRAQSNPRARYFTDSAASRHSTSLSSMDDEQPSGSAFFPIIIDFYVTVIILNCWWIGIYKQTSS
ncbi:hypothetical protein ANCCAN_08512 [Ancylostoma caninum]|uniref:Uncharacterized protein n=1 Tax=Ancylostoma caninum TaxID=29170 RepID=A0A368GQY4_ANCCA|nr:hypothetical protein ANCCAN_08512 [Ancylostoma caninum]